MELNCPNCGAPIIDNVCPYCGTYFYDFATLEIGKVGHIKINHGEFHNIFNACLTDISTNLECNTNGLYGDGGLILSKPIYDMTLDLSFHVMPDDEGVYFLRRSKM